MQIRKDKCCNIKAFRVEVVELKYIDIFNFILKEGQSTGLSFLFIHIFIIVTSSNFSQW